MVNADFCGDEFLGDSWGAWRVIARLIDGDAQLLTADQRALALRLTGRTTLPALPPGELFVGAGRRSGKSRFTAIVGTWLAAEDHSAKLAPGEVAVVCLVAPDREQSKLLLGYIRGLIAASPILSAEVVSENADSIDLAHRSRIEVVTGSYRSVRGRTLAAALLDEVAFLRSDESALPDIELHRALLPALLTLQGRLIAISSPHRRVGLLFDAHRRFFGNDSAERGLYVQSDNRTLNPTLSAADIQRATEADPEAAASEHGGKFRNDVQAYLTDELLDASVVEARFALPARPGLVYVAFCDPAGGTGADSMSLAISHLEAGRYVVDKLVARKPPFDPENVARDFVAELAEFGLASVVGDRYAGGWVVSTFSRHGISYEHAQLDKSSIYAEAAKIFAERKVDLVDDAKLLVELRLLERRPRSGGRPDLIDHPRGGHDDLANVVAGCLWLLAARDARALVVPEAVAIAATLRLAPDTRFAPRVFAAIVDGDRAYLAKRTGLLAVESRTIVGDPRYMAGVVATEADRFSALSIYLADTSPGQPVLATLRALNYSVVALDLFAAPNAVGYADLRTELAFRLADWLERATVPPTLLHDLTTRAYTTRRGSTELLDTPLSVVDALAVTLLDRSTYQDPRTINGDRHITHAITDDGRYGGRPASPPPVGLTQPFHLGDREPCLLRDGWSRCIPVADTARALTDYDLLDR